MLKTLLKIYRLKSLSEHKIYILDSTKRSEVQIPILHIVKQKEEKMNPTYMYLIQLDI